VLAVAGLPLGCQREADKAPIVIDARGAGAPIAAAQAAVGPTATGPSPPAAAVEPAREPFVDPLGAATVELSGAVIFPPGPPKAGRVFVFAAIGDCLDPSTVPLRRMPATEDGAFMLHTLATPGSELSVCAAVEGGAARGPGLSSTLYGQAQARIRIEKTADLVLHEVQIPLRAGAPRRFADAKKSASH
jgi:hypothetical protein